MQRLVLFVTAVLLFGCTYTPHKKRLDLVTYGALRQTGCTEKKLKITRASYTEYESSCEGCSGGEVRFVASCDDRTWTCKQSAPSNGNGYSRNDLMTECVEIVAKPRPAEQKL
jgi:hypothetical protein